MEKFFFIKSKRPKGKVIWINGVSIGEAKSGLIVAEEILKKQPNTKILFSTSTQTAHKIISNLKKNIILVYTLLTLILLFKSFLIIGNLNKQSSWNQKSGLILSQNFFKTNKFYNFKCKNV